MTSTLRLFALASLSLVAACTTSTRGPGTPHDAGFDSAVVIGIDAGVDAAMACDPGLMACHGSCIEVSSDPRNCGRCDVFCAPDTGCVGGICNCHAPMLACGGSCIDPRTDATNCGSCGNACAAGQGCTAGHCIDACDAPSMICLNPVTPDAGGADVDAGFEIVPVCADLQADVNNCGRCNTRCGTGGMCTAGHCMCPTGLIGCTGGCIDPATDPSHCGSCASSCGPGGTCASGLCTDCGGGLTLCGSRCIDTSADPRNCGSCARPCSGSETCSGGLCSCAAPAVDCGAGCTDLMTDVTNCGTCGTDCGPGGVCTAGACTCAAGLTMCSGSCRDLRTDRNNCGMCGMACPMGQVCIMNACSAAPPTHYTQSTPTAAEAPWIDACAATGHTTILMTVDDTAAATTLPFAFRYFATDLATGAPINVCSNGWLSMSGATGCSLSGTVPAVTAPNAVIAPHWGDDYTRATGVCVATVGTAPNRQFVVEWNDTFYCCGDTGLVHNTFEVVLNESSATIDLIYQTMTGARAQTMGLEDQTGAIGLNACPGGTGSCIPTAGQRVRFNPTP